MKIQANNKPVLVRTCVAVHLVELHHVKAEKVQYVATAGSRIADTVILMLSAVVPI